MNQAETALDGLRGLPSGTARVQCINVGERETSIGLGYPNGLDLVVSVPAVPRPWSGSPFPTSPARPMAVLIENGPSTLRCSVLCASSDGPARMLISLSEALALCDAGVHTVLRPGWQATYRAPVDVPSVVA